MESKFELGDRVKVYATLNGVVAQTKGVIEGKRIDGMLLVDFGIEHSGLCVAHPKQCRKLVKKPQRRVWINPEIYNVDINGTSRPAFVRFDGENTNGWIEFFEVKKK